MGKRPQKISVDELYEYARNWTAMRVRSFPLWDFDDIHHEAFLFGLKLAQNYNPAIGTVHQYLSQRLYDYVSRSYYKKNDILVYREMKKNRKMGPREYRSLLTYRPNSELPDPGYTDEQLHDSPDLSSLSDTIYETALLLGQGKTQRQCSNAAGVSEGAISKRVSKLRDLLDPRIE